MDAGRGRGTRIPPLIARLKAPERLRIVLAVPRRGHGLSGGAEDEVFKHIRGDPALSREASRIVLMKLLPSLIEEDLAGFAEAAMKLDEINGMIFSRVQKGIIRKGSEIIAKAMLEAGALGVGQSSWGPTIYGFADSSKNASRLADSIKAFEGFKALITEPRNLGAEILPDSQSITSRSS